MGAVLVARGGVPMPVFESPDPLDEVEPRNMRFPRRTLMKLSVIAQRERAAGKKSPLTKRVVSVNDVAWAFIESGIAAYEAQHGPIDVSAAIPDDEEAPVQKPGARPAMKKGAPLKAKR